jgi:hypothetical protein
VDFQGKFKLFAADQRYVMGENAKSYVKYSGGRIAAVPYLRRPGLIVLLPCIAWTE